MKPPAQASDHGNLYELEVWIEQPSGTGDQPGTEKLHAHLRRPATGASWPGWTDIGTEFAFSELIRRCSDLQRHPETLPDLAQQPYGPDGQPILFQRDPDPAHVQDMTWAAIDDIGAWLFDHLPATVRAELRRAFLGDDSSTAPRVLVRARGDAAVLPWHRLCVPAPSTAGDDRGKRRIRRGELWMQVDGGPTTGDRLQPRVVLLVGSQKLDPGDHPAEHSVIDVVGAIRNAGFRCEVWSGKAIVAGYDLEVGAWRQFKTIDELCEALRTCDSDILHFMGHSNAHRGDGQPRFGADALMFEFEGEQAPQPLLLTSLATALRQRRDGPGWQPLSRIRFVVTHACLTRELVAHALLGLDPDGTPTNVDSVLTMGAMAPPPVCAAFATTFYQELRKHAHVPTALTRATLGLRKDYPGFDWLPMYWTRSGATLRLADPRTTRVAGYFRSLLDGHLRLEGLFSELQDGLERIGQDAALSHPQRPGHINRVQNVLNDCAAGGETPDLSHLVQAGGWWMLCGKSGSGKTTSLRRYVRRLACDAAQARVPIYLTLTSWLRAVREQIANPKLDASTWLFDHVAQQATQLSASDRTLLAQDLATLAATSELVVLLDGFDELPPDLRDLLTTPGTGVLARLRGMLGTCPLIVATRRHESSMALPQEWFGDVDLAPLAPEEALALFGRALRTYGDEAAAKRHLEWLRKELFDRRTRQWLEVAQTPLLVCLLALMLLRGKTPAVSPLQFFEHAFDVLARHQHRPKPASGRVPLSDREYTSALPALQYLAWRLTLATTRSATLATWIDWLAPPAGTTEPDWLRPTPQVVDAVLGRRWQARKRSWWERLWHWRREQGLPSTPEARRDRAREFLHRIAEATQILGPEVMVVGLAEAGEQDKIEWRFWHKSFQEALCALHLDARFVAPAKTETAGVSVLVREMKAWGIGGEPDQTELQERARQLAASQSLSDLEHSAQRAPADDPVAQWRAYVRASKQGWDPFRAYCAVVAARAEIQHRRLEPFFETLALLATRLQDPHPLLVGLLSGSWHFAWRVALALPHVPAASLPLVLERLPTLRQRIALIERAAEAADDARKMLGAFAARGTALAPCVQPTNAPRVGDADAAAVWRRRVWDAPGELFALLEACRILARHKDLAAEAERTSTALMKVLPVPSTEALQASLRLVPGRESEVEPGLEDPGIRMWRHVPAGEFWMGTADGGRTGNEPLHWVSVKDPFWIASVPVTVGLYRLFSPQHEVWCGSATGYRRVDDPELDANTAVGGVSCSVARLFCLWLQRHAIGPSTTATNGSRQPGWLTQHLRDRAAEVSQPVPEAVEVRLPYEAEWEYAARAGSETAYFFGNDEADLPHWAWFWQGPSETVDRDAAAPQPVASLRGQAGVVPGAPAEGANSLGLFDVHGNVWEWCLDRYRSDPTGPEGGMEGSVDRSLADTPRVTRGGSCWLGADDCRSATRDRLDPFSTNDNQGFRLVCVRVRPQLG